MPPPIDIMSIMSDANVTLPLRPSRRGEAPWEILERFPRQGEWAVEDYRDSRGQGPLVELNDGVLEVLPTPDWVHQAIAIFLFDRLREHREGGQAGLAVLPPFNLKTLARKYRHPDAVYLRPANGVRFRSDFRDYADFVVEVLSGSPADRERDLVEKRSEYAAAGIPEYWIVDPVARTILVLSLDGSAYREAGTYGEADVARSIALEGFAVDVRRMFADAQPPTAG